MLDRLKKANLSLKPAKREWFKETIKYLGHIVSQDGIRADPQNVAAIFDRSPPQDKDDVCSFLGAIVHTSKIMHKKLNQFSD